MPLATAEEPKMLKTKCVQVAVTLLTLVSVTPASAAPREIEDFCFEQSQQAVPARRVGSIHG
jgi:hypothetical protein